MVEPRSADRRRGGHGRARRAPRPVRSTVEPPGPGIRLARSFGATVHQQATADREEREATVARVAADIVAAGGRPYVIETGGSGAIGAWGQVLAGRELFEQADAHRPRDRSDRAAVGDRWHAGRVARRPAAPRRGDGHGRGSLVGRAATGHRLDGPGVGRVDRRRSRSTSTKRSWAMATAGRAPRPSRPRSSWPGPRGSSSTRSTRPRRWRVWSPGPLGRVGRPSASSSGTPGACPGCSSRSTEATR